MRARAKPAAPAPWAACAVWVRYTDAAGRATAREHQCWDPERFMRARAEEAAQANAQFAKENRRKRGKARAERLTEAQYDKETQA